MTTREQASPGTSMPCQKPIVANRHVAGSAAKASTRRPLGADRWVRIGTDDAIGERGGRLVEHPEAGEQREGPPAGRLDQLGQLVGQRRQVPAVAGIGEVGRAVQDGLVLVVERAADIELGDPALGHAETARQAGRGGWRW